MVFRPAVPAANGSRSNSLFPLLRLRRPACQAYVKGNTPPDRTRHGLPSLSANPDGVDRAWDSACRLPGRAARVARLLSRTCVSRPPWITRARNASNRTIARCKEAPYMPVTSLPRVVFRIRQRWLLLALLFVFMAVSVQYTVKAMSGKRSAIVRWQEALQQLKAAADIY